MRKLVLYIGVLMLGSSADAVINPNLKPAFADLTWYSNRSAVKQQMTTKGYVFLGDSRVGNTLDSTYSGKILSIPATIRHQFNNLNQLVRTFIIFEKTPGVSLYSNFDSLRSSLNKKYGMGIDRDTVDINYRNDTLLGLELSRGKTASVIWSFPTNQYFIGIQINKVYVNNDNYYLSLGYESPAWPKEAERRDEDSDL